MLYKSTFAPSAVPRNESFWQCMLRLNVDDTPDDTVILQEHERPDRLFTYGSAPRLAGLGADGLREVIGLKRGDTILVVGTNTLDYLHIEYAALWSGVVAALGNASATTSDLVHLIDTAQPAAIFCDPGPLMENMAAALAQSTQPRTQIIGIGTRGTAKLAFPADCIKDTDADPVQAPLDLSSIDNHTAPALICFSSGTTSGRPKAAVLSHHNVLAYPLLYRASEPTTANHSQRDVFYAPLAHIYGVFVATTMPVFTGGYVRLMRSYSLPAYLAACADARATTLRMVPPTLVAMVKLLQQQQAGGHKAAMDLSSVTSIVCAGAMLAPEMIGAVHSLLGESVAIVQAYGMTEGLATIVNRFAATRKQGSVGRPVSGGQLRIVDDNLRDVQPGDTGEIVISSPTVFMGYKNDKAATAEAFPYSPSGGNVDNTAFLRTGDVGHMDGGGFLWLTDRKKDMIKYKGHQVSPAELENLLHAHPLVQEAGVCAAWDAVQQTEVPVGYVNLVSSVADGRRASVLDDVRASVDGQVAHHKKLRGGLFFLATMPRNATGKLLRRNLPARLEAARTSKL
ncbi:luciferin 4-monooxygenase [Sporothrix brasiliensis 5110]|uniref:Luciferin 4-monooxygenase n=1 Tax=Sporothrix brasiliensis 5110 TaxID=1398154 RepID=A0A0C2FQG6_9PEZI|nr:luciferin 4-monooxygenase [Sporothrix brasiliensis 5110]KIH93293.1 luciferin 4-monooxygenase [Sporothrix brasiliensis 5110]